VLFMWQLLALATEAATLRLTQVPAGMHMQALPPIATSAGAKAKAADKLAAAPDTPGAGGAPGSPRSKGLSEALSRAKALALARAGGKPGVVVSTRSSDDE
jgi:hypothetical protein